MNFEQMVMLIGTGVLFFVFVQCVTIVYMRVKLWKMLFKAYNRYMRVTAQMERYMDCNMRREYNDATDFVDR